MADDIKASMLSLKTQLMDLETQMFNKMQEHGKQDEQFSKTDEEAENYLKGKLTSEMIQFNIGGKLFSVNVENLLKYKDTLFYKIICCKSIDVNNPIYIERSFEYFPVILQYLRHGIVNLGCYSYEELENLREEANYYELTGFLEIIDLAIMDGRD